MFMNHPLFAAIAAALATQSLRFAHGKRGQSPARGIVSLPYSRPRQAKTSFERLERRRLVRSLGRRQALIHIKNARRFAKEGS